MKLGTSGLILARRGNGGVLNSLKLDGLLVHLKLAWNIVVREFLEACALRMSFLEMCMICGVSML
eukprot:6486102-Amphidinium_carterae.1